MIVKMIKELRRRMGAQSKKLEVFSKELEKAIREVQRQK